MFIPHSVLHILWQVPLATCLRVDPLAERLSDGGESGQLFFCCLAILFCCFKRDCFVGIDRMSE